MKSFIGLLCIFFHGSLKEDVTNSVATMDLPLSRDTHSWLWV